MWVLNPEGCGGKHIRRTQLFWKNYNCWDTSLPIWSRNKTPKSKSHDWKKCKCQNQRTKHAHLISLMLNVLSFHICSSKTNNIAVSFLVLECLFHQYNQELLVIHRIFTFLTIVQWWQHIVQEGTYEGLQKKWLPKDYNEL